jgi:hypothetical protein
MASLNGTAAELPAEATTELGTADDGNPFGLFFDSFEGNSVIEVRDPRDDDFEKMLVRDGRPGRSRPRSPSRCGGRT